MARLYEGYNDLNEKLSDELSYNQSSINTKHREQTLSKDVREKMYIINREVLKEKHDVVITEPIEDTLKRPFDIVR